MDRDKKPIVYVDMDNTAVDFTKQAVLFKHRYPTVAYPQSIVGFFSTMEPIAGFLEAWCILSEFYDMRFLTRPSLYNLNSYTEKAQWVRDNMGGVEALEVLNLCPDKSLLKGDYLIDDFDIHGQSEFEGEFLQFGQKGAENWEVVTRYLLDRAGVTEESIKHLMRNF